MVPRRAAELRRHLLGTDEDAGRGPVALALTDPRPGRAVFSVFASRWHVPGPALCGWASAPVTAWWPTCRHPGDPGGFTATAGLGAVWAGRAPEFGVAASSTGSLSSSLPSCSPSPVHLPGPRRRPPRRGRLDPDGLPTCAIPHVPDGPHAFRNTLSWAGLFAEPGPLLRTGPVRPPPHGAVLLRDDRTAEGHGPRPRRPARRDLKTHALSWDLKPAAGCCGTPPPPG